MTLRQFYRVAVWTFITTITVLVILNVALAVVGSQPLQNLPFLIRLPLGVLGVFGAVGIITVWFGMMWDCAVTSRLPLISKLGWFLLIVFTNMLGTLIYYFLVFQRQTYTLARGSVVT